MHIQILHVKACLHRADARYFVDLIGELSQFLHTVMEVDGFIAGASMMILRFSAQSYDASSATKVAET
jgi:hypothetical protein